METVKALHPGGRIDLVRLAEPPEPIEEWVQHLAGLVILFQRTADNRLASASLVLLGVLEERTLERAVHRTPLGA